MARSRKVPDGVEALIAERDRLLAESRNTIAEGEKIIADGEKLGEQAKGIDWAINSLTSVAQPSGETEAPHQARSDVKRGRVKVLLLDLLGEVGAVGLNATSAVILAENKGITLLRGTAASNLSRMKADRVVVHDGDKYRLPEFTRQPPLSAIAGGKLT